MARALGLLGILALLLVAPGLDAGEDDYTYRFIDGAAPLGASGTVIVILDNNGEDLAGYSIAVCHDTTLIDIESVDDIVNGSGLVGVGFFFHATKLIAEDEKEKDSTTIGWTVGTALNFGEVLEPAVNIELYEVDYLALDDDPERDEEEEIDAELEFCEIGTPITRPTVVEDDLTEIVEGTGLELINGVFTTGGTPPFTLTAGMVQAPQGTVAEVPILVGAPEDFDAFSYGISFSDEFLTLDEVLMGSALESLNNDDGPDYYQVNILDDDSAITIGCLADLDAPFETIAAGEDIEVALLQFSVDPATPDETPVAINFSGSFGDPAVPVVISVRGVSKPPARTNGEVFIKGDPIPVFLRGDSNTDGFVDISDVLHIARHLFVSGAPSPQCSEAADVNDSDDITITDAIALLSYLFEDADEPPAPFPECDLDPDEEDALECETTQADACI